MNKTFTTPDYYIRIPGAAELLKQAQRVIVTVSGNNFQFDLEEGVSFLNDTVIYRLSQGQTGRLGAGKIEIEVTLVFESGIVQKTETVTTTLAQSVRRGVA